MSTSSLSPTTAVVTCYNHQAYVEQCLDSIAEQSVPPREILIFDDASTDDSASVIDHWVARHGEVDATLHRSPVNVGVCAVMNRALAAIDTDTYFHISADDWADPDRVRVQTATLAAADAEIAFVVSDIIEVDAGGLTLAEHDIRARLAGLTGLASHESLYRQLLDTNIVPAPGVMMRTATVRLIGGYDESLDFEDYDLWLRLTEHYGVEYAPCTAAHYRILASSLTRRTDRALRFLESEERILRKHLGKDADLDKVVGAHLERVTTARDDLTPAATVPTEARGVRRRRDRPEHRRARSRSGD